MYLTPYFNSKFNFRFYSLNNDKPKSESIYINKYIFLVIFILDGT